LRLTQSGASHLAEGDPQAELGAMDVGDTASQHVAARVAQTLRARSPTSSARARHSEPRSSA
jgi:hypothetical protein